MAFTFEKLLVYQKTIDFGVWHLIHDHRPVEGRRIVAGGGAEDARGVRSETPGK